MTKERETWGPGYSTSYKKKFDEPMVPMVVDSDETVLDRGETCVYGYELTQEVLSLVWGKMKVHKGSYVVVRLEREVIDM